MRKVAIALFRRITVVLVAVSFLAASSSAQILDLGGTPAPIATAPPGTTPPATNIPATTPPATNPPVTVPSTTAAPAAPETTGDTAGWGGCVDPNDPDEKLVLGKKTTICLTLSQSVEWNKTPPPWTLRLSFQPLADEYSRFHVPNSYNDLIKQPSPDVSVSDGTNNVAIHVASQKVISFQRMFYSPTEEGGFIFPYLTAIIDVSKGVVKGITWDDACLFCSKDQCEENTYDFNGNQGTQKEFKQPTKGCYIPKSECDSVLEDEEPLCDITLYVVWTGDDANGRAFQSSAFRFSAFPEQELQNRISNNIPFTSSTGGETTNTGEESTNVGGEEAGTENPAS